jgi:hypothetical protein
VDHSITGSVLLNLDDDDLKTHVAIDSSLQRSLVLKAISSLKKEGQQSNLTFWEYRSMNRKTIDRIMPMLNSAPRWAITLFD